MLRLPKPLFFFGFGASGGILAAGGRSRLRAAPRPGFGGGFPGHLETSLTQMRSLRRTRQRATCVPVRGQRYPWPLFGTSNLSKRQLPPVASNSENPLGRPHQNPFRGSAFRRLGGAEEDDLRLPPQRRRWETQVRQTYDRGDGAVILPYDRGARHDPAGQAVPLSGLRHRPHRAADRGLCRAARRGRSGDLHQARGGRGARLPAEPRAPPLRPLHEPGQRHRAAVVLRRRLLAPPTASRTAAATRTRARTSRCWR